MTYAEPLEPAKRYDGQALDTATGKAFTVGTYRIGLILAGSRGRR